MQYRFQAELWQHDGAGGWHFVTLPADVALGIKALTGRVPGFGSVRVTAAISDQSWQTSVFPDRQRGTYLLPVKAAVRRSLSLSPGDTLTVTIDLTL